MMRSSDCEAISRPQEWTVREPMLANSRRQVVVDLGDRADRRARVRPVVFCSMAMAGDRPSMRSTSGFSICSRNCRAYDDSDST
jgi:hypothetical protein